MKDKRDRNWITVGERLKAARKKAGFTQAQIADKLGVSVKMVSFWEMGRSIPRADRLTGLAGLYSTPAESLVYSEWIPEDIKGVYEMTSGTLELNARNLTEEDLMAIKRFVLFTAKNRQEQKEKDAAGESEDRDTGTLRQRRIPRRWRTHGRPARGHRPRAQVQDGRATAKRVARPLRLHRARKAYRAHLIRGCHPRPHAMHLP